MSNESMIIFPDVKDVKFYPYRRAIVRDVICDIKIENPDDFTNLTCQTMKFLDELFEMAGAKYDNHVCFEAKLVFTDKPVFFMWSDWHFYI